MQQVLELFGSRKPGPKSAAFARSPPFFPLQKIFFFFFTGSKFYFTFLVLRTYW